MVSVAIGWDMYDPRLTIKGELAEACDIGDCCRVGGDGLIYLSDTDNNACHGCALEAGEIGDWIVLITHGRLRMSTAQTPGALERAPKEGSGVGSPPDDAGAGAPVGWAGPVDDGGTYSYLIIVNITYTSQVSV